MINRKVKVNVIVHRGGVARTSVYPVQGPTGRLKNKSVGLSIPHNIITKLVKTKTKLNIL